jgi:hypothetical protein
VEHGTETGPRIRIALLLVHFQLVDVDDDQNYHIDDDLLYDIGRNSVDNGQSHVLVNDLRGNFRYVDFLQHLHRFHWSFVPPTPSWSRNFRL